MEVKFYKKKWFAIIGSILLSIAIIVTLIFMFGNQKKDIDYYQKAQQSKDIQESLDASARLAIGISRNTTVKIVEDNKVNIYVDLPKTLTKRELLSEEARIVNEIQKTKYKDYVSGLTIQHMTDYNNKDNKDITAMLFLKSDKLKGEYTEKNITANATLSWVKDGIKEY